MAPYKRTATGFELTGRFISLVISVCTLIGIFGGTVIAGARAATRLEATATKTELRDSIKTVRDLRQADSIRGAAHESDQDKALTWYGRQTWALICSKYNNPEAFCKEPDPSVLQAGRPR